MKTLTLLLTLAVSACLLSACATMQNHTTDEPEVETVSKTGGHFPAGFVLFPIAAIPLSGPIGDLIFGENWQGRFAPNTPWDRRAWTDEDLERIELDWEMQGQPERSIR